MHNNYLSLHGYKETMNALIILMQNQQNFYLESTDALAKAIAGAKVEAYQTAIDVFQSQMNQRPVLPDNWGVAYG